MISDHVRRVIAMALAEDIGHGDATTVSTIPMNTTAVADMVARSPLTVSGLEVAGAVFEQVDPEIRVQVLCEEGEVVKGGTVLATISGEARSLLTAERTALNFVQHLCGIATQTRRYVHAIEGTGAQVVDTRKTVPGFRDLAKAAVRAGGGRNHRLGLDDGILIKDNHVVAAGGVAAAVRSARENGGYLLQVEVECDTLDQVAEALDAGANILLLDNMSPETLTEAVSLCRGKARTEASGGVNLDTIRVIAETGVDFISVGALTHSVKAADIALDFRPPDG